MTVSKFKVGDRVRCVNAEGAAARIRLGQTYTVSRVEDFYGATYLHVCELADPSGFFPKRFEAEPLKLEVGATVVIDGGKDEWEVTGIRGSCASFRKNLVTLTTSVEILTVVKAKPEPSFYVNCADKIPRDGDVYLNQHGGLYVWRRGGDVYSHKYRRIGPSNGLAKERTLLVRDGKPYTG